MGSRTTRQAEMLLRKGRRHKELLWRKNRCAVTLQDDLAAGVRQASVLVESGKQLTVAALELATAAAQEHGPATSQSGSAESPTGYQEVILATVLTGDREQVFTWNPPCRCCDVWHGLWVVEASAQLWLHHHFRRAYLFSYLQGA